MKVITIPDDLLDEVQRMGTEECELYTQLNYLLGRFIQVAAPEQLPEPTESKPTEPPAQPGSTSTTRTSITFVSVSPVFSRSPVRSSSA